MVDFRFICLNLENFNQNGYYKFDPNLFKNKFQNACLNPLIDSRYLIFEKFGFILKTNSKKLST
jgi:hypothetical protein